MVGKWIGLLLYRKEKWQSTIGYVEIHPNWHDSKLWIGGNAFALNNAIVSSNFPLRLYRVSLKLFTPAVWMNSNMHRNYNNNNNRICIVPWCWWRYRDHSQGHAILWRLISHKLWTGIQCTILQLPASNMQVVSMHMTNLLKFNSRHH